MSVFDVIAQQESGGGKNLYNPVATSSGHAEGWYGITTGTWQDFAPQAGVDLAQYPTPNAAPQSIQQQVAGQIPLSRWAPSTVSAVHSAYPSVTDDNRPVATLDQSANDPNAWITGGGPGTPTNTTEPGNSMITGGGGTTPTTVATSLLNPVWEVVSRGLLIVAGFALLMTALIAMLFQSKTVRTTVQTARAATGL